MRNQEEALARIVRHLNGQRIEEVADRILALFNEPPWWKSEDKHEVYTVSECGEIQCLRRFGTASPARKRWGLWQLLQEPEGRRTCS